jgi:DNA-binding SARP family transcriptional activator
VALPAAADSPWQRAIELVRARQYQQAASLLDQTPRADSAGTTTLLRETLSAARQICLACDRFLQETRLLQQAGQLAADQERELGEHLIIILQEALGHLGIPPVIADSAPHVAAGVVLSQTAEKPPGLWTRLQRLLTVREGHVPESDERPGTVGPALGETRGALTWPIAAENERLPARAPTFVVFSLGLFRFYDDEQAIVDWPNRRSKSVLKYLLLHGEQPVRRELLMETFWPDHDPSAARNNLNVAIYTLRQALRRGTAERSTILFRDESYALNPDLGVWLDVDEFHRRAKGGRWAMRRGHMDEAVREYETAVELYQGDLLEEDLYEPWTEQPRRELREAYVDALNFLSGYYEEARQDAPCIGYCRRLLAAEPADEAIHRRLMRAYARQNQRYLAIRQYQQCVEALREHLAVAPDAETVRLYEQILHERPV